MNKAYKFRIYPNSEQQVLLAKTFGCVRFIYNKMLGEKIAYYEDTGKILRTTPAGYKSQYEWLKEVDSLALANEQMHLETAYKNFFRDKKIGFPKFKSKHKGHNSYTTNLVNGNIVLFDRFLKLPKLGKIRIKQHRAIPENNRLKSVTVSLTPTGKYYASVLYEYDINIKEVLPENVIGLDFSMGELYVDSNGIIPKFPRPYKTIQAKLAKEQRKLSKRKKGGSNYRKQRRKVALIHEKAANQRKDFLHKRSRQIANAYDAVCIEDLDMKAMSQSLSLGKSISDNGWGSFVRMLDYKLNEQGKILIKVDRWYPSSKTCSHCGFVKDNLVLSERIFCCDSCGLALDRDYNSAINIRKEGIKLLA